MNANVKLRELLQAMYEHSYVAEDDARRSARVLGGAKNGAQTLGAQARYEADGEEIFSRHVQGAIDIAYTIASIVVGQSSGGGGGSGGGAKAPSVPNATWNLLLQNTGVAGAMIDGAIRGAAEGGFAGAVKGALQGAFEWMMSNSGLAGQLVSASTGDSLQDHLRYGRIGKARELVVDGVRVGDILSDAQLEKMASRIQLDALPNQVAGAAVQRGSEVIGNLIADRAEDVDGLQAIAQHLAQAEAEAKKRRAKAQVARAEIEGVIVGVEDLTILA